MAVAAPLVVIAADALLDAIVTVGSALAGSLGLIALAEAIDKNFSKDKSSATKPCDKDTKPEAQGSPESEPPTRPPAGKDSTKPPESPRPKGIPDNWVEKPTRTPGGKEYINPD